MIRTGITHEDLLQLDFMIMTAKEGARIDGVAVVKAATYGIALDDFDAHVRKRANASMWVLS